MLDRKLYFCIFVNDALSENGYVKTAYSLLLQEEYPSWLYEVNHNATTIWEHWNGNNISNQETFDNGKQKRQPPS